MPATGPDPAASGDGATGGEASFSRRDASASARDRALRLLARREKSRAGLERVLRRAGFAAGIVRETVDRLEVEGLVDDRRYCRLYIGSQSRLRPRSARLLRRDLMREGIPGEIVDAALAEAAAELNESDLARAAVRRKLRAAGADPDRLRRWLAARGFGRGAIEAALRAECDSAGRTGEQGHATQDGDR